MSKKKKKNKSKRRGVPPITAKDRHHICFTKAAWGRGYAKSICTTFVRPIPVVYHRELHANLHFVPVPPGDQLREAWVKYQRNKDEIDSYDICRAIAWLYVNIPDEDFRKAMQYQLDFFSTRLQATGERL